MSLWFLLPLAFVVSCFFVWVVLMKKQGFEVENSIATLDAHERKDPQSRHEGNNAKNARNTKRAEKTHIIYHQVPKQKPKQQSE